MAIKSDAQGFLIGELIRTQDQVLTAQQDSVRVQSRIRADVSAIARALNVQTKTRARTTVSGQGGQRAPRVASVVVGRSSNGSRTVGGNQTAGPTSRAASSGSRRSSATVAVAASRDSQGRFVAGQGRGGAAGASGGASLASIGGGLSRLSDGMGRLSASLASADNIDPTVNAMKEVTDVVSPIGRGLFSMFGRGAERKKERWYQRILSAITDKKPGGSNSSSSSTMVVGGGGMAGGMLRGAGDLLKGGGKLLKRLPLIGALLSGGLALGSAFGMDDDPSKTPEENRAQRYKGAGGAAGMGVGGIIGGVLGSALGPVGTVVGGYLGSMAGEVIGEKAGLWAKDMMDSDIGGRIVQGWETTTAFIGGMWESLVTDAKTAWGSITKTASEWWDTTKDAAGKLTDKVGELAGNANDWIKQKTGVDVKASASNAWDATKKWAGDKAGQAAEYVKDNAGALVPNTVKRAVAAGSAAATQAKAGYDEARGNPSDAPAPKPGLQSGARAAGGAAGSAANWVLGKTSERYESGGKGAGTVSTGAGDFGGASYGTYQLASKTGTLDKFLKSTEYGKQFEGMKAGSAEFNAKWKDVAKNDAGFGDAQHKFIEDTHYNPQMQALQKAGIDLSGRGAAVKDSVWSTSVQFGGNSSLIQKALAGKDHTKMSDAEIVSSIQDYKATNNDKLFASSSAAVRAGTLNRATSEKSALLKLDSAQTAGLPTPAVAGVPASVPAQLPDQAKNEVPEAINSGAAAGGKVQVSLKDKTTQNIGDRGIAHIVTGGMGA